MASESHLLFLAATPFLFLLLVSADVLTTTPVTPGSICRSTKDPSFCKAVLPNATGNVFDFCRFSVRKSLSQSRKFLSLVNKYLRRRSSLTVTAIRALEDCQFLAGLNMDYLSTSFRTVNVSGETLPEMEVDYLQTLLSACLTNQQTCLDGLRSTSSAWSFRNGLALPLANDTKLYSVSLALFTRGWASKKKKKRSSPSWIPPRKHLGFRKEHFTMKMTARTQAIYEKLSRRNLLQTTEDDGDDGGSVTLSDIVVVSQDGTGNFTTINDAIAVAPNDPTIDDGYFLIYVTAGVYQEYVSIAKKKRYLIIVGDGINQTIITGNRNVIDGWTTFNSATFAVVAPGFIGVDLTIRNTAGAIKHQAVALRNGADLSVFYSCSFEGYQDTLYTHSLRQFYRECDVYGTIDFIFGNAAVVLQNCNIYPRLPLSNQYNTITAQGRTDQNQNTGTSIHNCTIVAADDLASGGGSIQTYFGRPWKEYSRTVVMQSYIGSLINPAGWRAWDGEFALKTLYYAEFNNSGPGSNTTGRVEWDGYHREINSTDAANFTVSTFLMGDDWLPLIGIPYTGGLIS